MQIVVASRLAAIEWVKKPRVDVARLMFWTKETKANFRAAVLIEPFGSEVLKRNDHGSEV